LTVICYLQVPFKSWFTLLYNNEVIYSRIIERSCHWYCSLNLIKRWIRILGLPLWVLTNSHDSGILKFFDVGYARYGGDELFLSKVLVSCLTYFPTLTFFSIFIGFGVMQIYVTREKKSKSRTWTLIWPFDLFQRCMLRGQIVIRKVRFTGK
jgi:hypothetical protein